MSTDINHGFLCGGCVAQPEAFLIMASLSAAWLARCVKNCQRCQATCGLTCRRPKSDKKQGVQCFRR